MSFAPCTHKAWNDHAFQRADGKLVWTCSNCAHQNTWGEGWGYQGNVECSRCWAADIDYVACSEQCAIELGLRHGTKANNV